VTAVFLSPLAHLSALPTSAVARAPRCEGGAVPWDFELESVSGALRNALLVLGSQASPVSRWRIGHSS